MAPTSLHGLNIVHSAQSFDPQDLLSGSAFPDLSAQLDLWTNLSFESDDGPSSRHDESFKSQEHEEDDEQQRGEAAAIRDGHINVVTGTNLGSNAPSIPPSQSSLFDLQSFLAGFNPSATSASGTQFSAPQATPAPNVPSLAQLLALHNLQQQQQQQQLSIITQPQPQQSQQSTKMSQSPTSAMQTSNEMPPAKKSRTRKASISNEESPVAADANVNVSEDKRRRNTAASARFRMKKKEREVALEGKAKELEMRVSELERECEGLRRENGWLKGLVVGVTGAAQQQQQTVPAPNLLKRSRDETV